ncbi:Uncharacterized protein FKW44_007978, partial [Caligus rogercresseyi]
NKQKNLVIEQGVVPRLLKFLLDPQSKPSLKAEVAIALGSLAKGHEDHLKAIIDSQVVPVLLDTLLLECSSAPGLTEALLRCLRSIFNHPEAPVDSLYSNRELLPLLMSLIQAHPITVPSILTNACKVRVWGFRL